MSILKPRLKIIKIIIIFSFQLAASYAQPRHIKFKRNYNTQHIKLELNFNEQEKSVTGTATLTIVPLNDNFNSCTFHASDMEINNVKLDKKYSLKFLADSEIVVIEFPQNYSSQDTLNISISYYTIPHKGIYFNAPTKKNPTLQYQIFSYSEPTYARYWFPCYDEPDDKLTSEIIATVKEPYCLLSNGRLLEIHENPASHTKTFHWLQDKPHVTYLISIVAGEYVIINNKSNTIPLQYYVYKDKVEQATYTFLKTPQMIDFFSQKFGYPYPWDKYAQIIVSNYKAKGMEHTSATTLIDKSIYDRRTHIDINSYELISHELAHQWLGDLVTCKDWSHLWLNEGFATYSEILFTEFDQGSEAAQYEVILQQQYYLQMEDTTFHQPIVYQEYLHPREMFNHISYQKASMVLYMLRNVIGDELFFKSLTNFLHKFAFQSVKTGDFVDVVENTSGQDLSWFFNQWLYHGGHPEFEVNYEWLPHSRLVVLNITQVQQDSFNLVPVFRMPVEIEIVTKNEKWLEKREIKNRTETMQFYVDSKPLMVRFDKNNVILKSIKFPKTQDEFIYQLLHDDNLWGRLDAIAQLKKNTEDTMATIEALKSALLHDSFWAVRRKAALTLEIFDNRELEDIYIVGCRDSNPKVRSVCVKILRDYEDPKLCPLFRSIANSDSSYWVITEAIYALIRFPDSLSFDYLNQFINMDSFNDMIQTAAFEGFREIRDKRSIPYAIKFARDPHQPFSRRYSALRLLEDIGAGDATVEKLLIDLLDDDDNIIQKKVIQILGNFETNNALLALKQFDKKNLNNDISKRVKHAINKIEQSLIK